MLPATASGTSAKPAVGKARARDSLRGVAVPDPRARTRRREAADLMWRRVAAAPRSADKRQRLHRLEQASLAPPARSTARAGGRTGRVTGSRWRPGTFPTRRTSRRSHRPGSIRAGPTTRPPSTRPRGLVTTGAEAGRGPPGCFASSRRRPAPAAGPSSRAARQGRRVRDPGARCSRSWASGYDAARIRSRALETVSSIFDSRSSSSSTSMLTSSRTDRLCSSASLAAASAS